MEFIDLVIEASRVKQPFHGTALTPSLGPRQDTVLLTNYHPGLYKHSSGVCYLGSDFETSTKTQPTYKERKNWWLE